jgi:PPM family protein phosphatase
MSRYRTSRRNPGSVIPYEHLPFTFAQYSVACERHPQRNEDSITIAPRSGMAAVFDGVGGSAAGEIASQTAARATLLAWKRAFRLRHPRFKGPMFIEECSTPDLCKLLPQILLEADELVRSDGAQQAGTDDLATTVALAAFCQNSASHDFTMVYAHVGDSRVYLLREQEPLKRLTSDDGLLGRLVENQMVNDEDAHRIDQAMHVDQLSDAEFNYFRLRGGITQALGGPVPPTIHIDQMSILPGDRILLCTDGIHDNLIEDEIEEILRKSPRTSAARLLVEHAILRSRQERYITVRAKPDDMSAIVITRRF